MRNNAIVFPEPNEDLLDHIDFLQQSLSNPYAKKDMVESELNMLLTLSLIRSKAQLESIRKDVTKFILNQKGSDLGLEVQRVFREYSFIYS